VPVLLGTAAGRVIASAMALGAAAWAWWGFGEAAWAVGLAGTQVVLAVAPTGLVRNATDLRLPLLAGVVWLMAGG
jgi:hypothetical protein